MSLLDAVPGVTQAKLIVGALIFAAMISLGLYVWGLKSDIKSLQADNKVLTVDNKQLVINVATVKDNVTVCQNANTVQNATIASLETERAESVKAVADLALKQTLNLQIINNMKTKLINLNADTKNNGPLANNLKETIRNIQSRKGVAQ